METFNAPIDQYGTPYWVPVVVKNKDWLVAFLYGYNSANGQVNAACTAGGLDVTFEITNLPINSMRYNNILPNGRDISKMSDIEIEKYLNTINENEMSKLNSSHPENKTNKAILNVECTCGLGFYSWNSENEIPNESLKCSNCEKYLIIYTNKNECEFNKPSPIKEEIK